jgi:hypothetical protein
MSYTQFLDDFVEHLLGVFLFGLIGVQLVVIDLNLTLYPSVDGHDIEHVIEQQHVGSCDLPASPEIVEEFLTRGLGGMGYLALLIN